MEVLTKDELLAMCDELRRIKKHYVNMNTSTNKVNPLTFKFLGKIIYIQLVYGVKCSVYYGYSDPLEYVVVDIKLLNKVRL